jgi:hypothetical protein
MFDIVYDDLQRFGVFFQNSTYDVAQISGESIAVVVWR